MRRILPFAALLPLVLAGCASSPTALTPNAAAQNSPFTQALAREYGQFADSEAAQMDWPDATTFRDKARMAAAGQVPAPEDPTKRGIGTGIQLNPDRDMGVEQRDQAIAGRQSLLSALSSDAPQRNPQATARAQVAYDCWVEQLEEGWQRDDIDRCRKAFNTAMGEVTARPIAQASPPPATASAERLQVYFAFDSARLTPQSRDTIAAAARDIKSREGARIEVDGHTDRAGPDSYNDKLSQARAQVVRQELMADGVPPERIITKAFGERQLAVPTPDGIAQPENRRTVVEFD